MKPSATIWKKPFFLAVLGLHIAAALLMLLFALLTKKSLVQPFTEIFVPLLGAFLLGACAIGGLSIGVAPGRYGSSASKEKQPVMFWIAITTYSVLSLAFAYLFIRGMIGWITS